MVWSLPRVSAQSLKLVFDDDITHSFYNIIIYSHLSFLLLHCSILWFSVNSSLSFLFPSSSFCLYVSIYFSLYFFISLVHSYPILFFYFLISPVYTLSSLVRSFHSLSILFFLYFSLHLFLFLSAFLHVTLSSHVVCIPNSLILIFL